jgi:hypothetical protein
MYTGTSSTDATVAVTLALMFPQDWTVDGSIQLVINDSTGYFDIQNITVTYQAPDTESAIPIGDTGMFLTEMSATVQSFKLPACAAGREDGAADALHGGKGVARVEVIPRPDFDGRLRSVASDHRVTTITWIGVWIAQQPMTHKDPEPN